MKTDPIVQEVREARAAIAAEFGYDLSKYLAWIREQTKLRKESGDNSTKTYHDSLRRTSHKRKLATGKAAAF